MTTQLRECAAELLVSMQALQRCLEGPAEISSLIEASECREEALLRLKEAVQEHGVDEETLRLVDEIQQVGKAVLSTTQTKMHELTLAREQAARGRAAARAHSALSGNAPRFVAVRG